MKIGQHQVSKVLVACGIAVMASAAALTSPALASASPNSGIEHFRIISVNNQSSGSIIAKGLFNAGGTDYSGKSSDLASFPGGAFTIHHPGGSFTFSVNPKTCLARETGTGDYSLSRGYGVYAGIKGSGTFVFKGEATYPRLPNGTCDLSRSAQPTSQQQVITANGPVSFK
jgi:hypothetical protein